jgi:hypothetical protein
MKDVLRISFRQADERNGALSIADLGQTQESEAWCHVMIPIRSSADNCSIVAMRRVSREAL